MWFLKFLLFIGGERWDGYIIYYRSIVIGCFVENDGLEIFLRRVIFG